MDNGSDLRAVRDAELAELLRCACRFTNRCNPASQKIARVLKVEPQDCLLFPGHLTHTNPTSREGISVPF